MSSSQEASKLSFSPVLSCSDVAKSYNGFYALNGLTLHLPRGRIVGLLGPNGSGKTTLLKLIAGLLVPTFGSITVDGVPVGVETKKKVSYLPERSYFAGGMSVIETVNLFSDFYADFDRGMALDLIGRLDLPLTAKFKILSKGMKEKLQLVLVMSRKADLYLLDEPIGGVDPATRDVILDIVLRNYDRHGTILLSTHLIYDIEPILDDVVFLAGGGVMLADTCESLRANTGMSVERYFREVFRC